MRTALARCLPPLWAFVSCWAADLDHRIDALVQSGGAGIGFAGIHIVDTSTGRTLYKRNEDRLFLPASNFKILTTALALDRLGKHYRFVTRVLREGSGNLVLVGSGDPSFSGRSYPYRKNGAAAHPLQPIEDLAQQMVDRGLTRVDGDIAGDDRIYPWEPYPPSWTQDDKLREFGAPISGLSLSDNVISVTVDAAASAGDPPRLILFPPLEFLTIENRMATVPRAGQAKLQVHHPPDSKHWILDGVMPLGQSMAVLLPVDDPALFAATALYDALTRRGVAIRGKPVAWHRAFNEAYRMPEGEELASRTSPPLGEILQTMNKLSINLHAELLLREVGRVRRGEGSNEAGIAEAAQFLKESGIPEADWRADDGSGLSRNNLVTPRLLTQVLVQQYRKYGEEFVALFPAGGEDGTLDQRLCCVSEGRGIHAKTGTLARAATLSGYAESTTNGRLAFAILVNGFSVQPATVRSWIDKIATALLE
jgi:D-alanyl-D-alanine carboxypeptidase/D-alanyl-D-alanine-endopeptidase (penicillin-binding protein 4)